MNCEKCNGKMSITEHDKCNINCCTKCDYFFIDSTDKENEQDE